MYVECTLWDWTTDHSLPICPN